MKAKTLMMLALCLTTTAAKAQVVYGDDEKNYARTTGSSMPMSATNHNLQQQPSCDIGGLDECEALGRQYCGGGVCRRGDDNMDESVYHAGV